MLSIFINLLLVVHVFVSVLMLLVVLMQRPKSEGLGAAFGGGMTENMFGAQTTNVLTKFTVWLGGAFFALTLLLAVLYAKQASGESKLASQILIEEEVIAPDSPAPAAVPAPEEVKIQAEEIVVEPAPSETTAPAKAPETSLFDAPQAPTDTAPAEAAPAEAPENP